MRNLSTFEIEFLNVSVAHIIEKAELAETSMEKMDALKRVQKCFHPDVIKSMTSQDWTERLWRCSNAKVFKELNPEGLIEFIFNETIKASYRELGKYC